MSESIQRRINLSGLGGMSKRELTALLVAQLADNAKMRADLAFIAAKLDADAGVTDTNYAAGLTSTTASLTA